MPRIAANADDYAAPRVGIFFPANNNTSADGNLTGQCVTLIKWFMAEMSDVPSPFAARGDARYVGKRLVAEGLADEVPYSQRKRGDIITNEYGTYGHIYVQLSGGRVFEENANAGGAARRVLKDGTVVYAARIGSENESFRRDVHVYRLRSYKEQGSDQMIIQDADNWYGRCNKTHWLTRNRELGRDVFKQFVGMEFLTFVEICSDDPEADLVQRYQQVGATAVNDKWDQQIYNLQDAVNALKSRPSAEELQAVKDQAASLTSQLESAKKAGEEAQKRATELEAEHIEAQKAGNAFTQWIGEQISKIFKKG